MADADVEHELDVAAQTHSGPHAIDAARQQLNRDVYALVKDLMPFPDLHKTSDCDLIYRFLIAKKWDVAETAKGLRDYAAFRREQRLDAVLWETFPGDILGVLACTFAGFDREGHPLFFDRPDPRALGQLLVAFPREQLMRVHLRMMEQGRRLCKQFQTDRVTCVIDMSQLTMAVLANPAAIGFLREMAHTDQAMYPENMRYMLICNGGWTFAGLYKIVRPWLDPRVQQKIQFAAGGSGGSAANLAALAADLARFVDPQFLPPSLGGAYCGPPLITDAAILALPPLTPPTVQARVVAGDVAVAASPVIAAEAAAAPPDDFGDPAAAAAAAADNHNHINDDDDDL